MATGPGYPSPTNVWIPNWESSGKLIAQFSRNAKAFPIMNYAQLVKSPKMLGYFLKFGTSEQGRVVNLNDNIWNFGNERPQMNEGLENFNHVPFTTKRFDYGFNLDDDTESQAEWDIVEQHSVIHAAKAMTARTIRGITVLTTAASWQTAADPELSADHTATATVLAGGQFDLGSSTHPYIKIALDKIAVQIMLDTMSVVTPDMLQVVINPNQARLWAESQEIHDYIKGSPDAMNEIRTGSTPNAKYGPGLPSTIYGYKIVVENTVRVTTRKNVSMTATKAWAFPDQTMVVVARVGELEGKYGGPSWSTLTYFWYRDEMTLETFQDPKNRRMEHHVVDCNVPVLTSPLAGYYVTATTSVAS